MKKLELRPGDIILSLGTRDLSKGIQNVAGGTHSHAGLWTGEKVIESTLPKVHDLGFRDLAKKSEYMDAFRHRDSHGMASNKVVDRAKGFLGHDYCKIDLVVACAIGTFTAWMRQKSEWLAYNTQYAAGRTRLLLGWLLEFYRAATEPTVTCVELVVRAHMEAGLPIRIKLDPGGKVDFGLLWRAIKDLQKLNRDTGKVLEAGMSERELLASLKNDLVWAKGVHNDIQQAVRPRGARLRTSDLEAPVSVLKTIELVATGKWGGGRDTWYAGLVTPQQLATSPSLEPLGRLAINASVSGCRDLAPGRRDSASGGRRDSASGDRRGSASGCRE